MFSARSGYRTFFIYVKTYLPRLALTIVLTVGALVDTAEALQESAIRLPNESWEAARDRNVIIGTETSPAGQVWAQTQRKKATPLSFASPYTSGVKTSNLPKWGWSSPDLQLAFEQARDERIYKQNSRPDFPRRAPWLFPDDSCIARAAHTARSLSRQGYLRPGKIFAFGRLSLQTSFHPRGKVFWWFHTAAAYNVSGGVAVLDPSVEFTRPLQLSEWLGRISRKPSAVRITICDTYAYGPRTSSCFSGSSSQEGGIVSDVTIYLTKEWNRLVNLDFDPIRLLGDDPPWQ